MKTDNTIIEQSEHYEKNYKTYEKISDVVTDLSVEPIAYFKRKSFNTAFNEINVTVQIKKELRQEKILKLNSR